MTPTRRHFLAAIAATPLLAQRSMAGDEALYDPVPPANAVYLRLISAGAVAPFEIGEAQLTAHVASIGAYHIVTAGSYDTPAGRIELEPGASYSILAGADLRLVRDEVVENPAKCGLTLINLMGEGDARLFVPSRGLNVIEGIAPGGAGTREVNAVSVDLGIATAAGAIATWDSVKLRRRSQFTFLALSHEGTVAGVMSENTVA